MPSSAAPTTPWYRQPWPWFLLSLPATAVVAGLATFYIAASGWDGPVAQDYYKQGLAINEEIGRASRASELGLAARVSLSGLAIGERVRVELVGAQPLPVEAALRLRLVHPGRRDADRVAVLARMDVSPDGRSVVYAGEWSSGEADARLAQHPVAWQAIVETREWRIDGTFSAGGAGVFELRAR